jgi:hypothetical protein
MYQFQCPYIETVKAVGNYIDQWEMEMLVPCEDGIDVMANVYWEYLYAEGRSYASGLGQVSNIYFFFEQANIWNIEGYVKDGDTTGTITPDDILLDVKEMPDHHHVKIYPNPAEDILYVEIPKNSKVQIYNLIGRVVFDGTFTESKNQIKLGDFMPGIYLLQVFSGDRVYNQKVVVK